MAIAVNEVARLRGGLTVVCDRQRDGLHVLADRRLDERMWRSRGDAPSRRHE